MLPDDSEESGGIIDLRRYYYENAAWFFGILAVSPAFDAIRRGLEAGTMRNTGAWSNAVAAVLVASLGYVRRPWYHALITLIVAALFMSFIVSSALELR